MTGHEDIEDAMHAANGAGALPLELADPPGIPTPSGPVLASGVDSAALHEPTLAEIGERMFPDGA